MTVCSYYLRGQCRFGDRCKNEHPKDKNPGFGNSNPIQYLYTIDSLSKDLSIDSDKPSWSLSSFGPAKYEPNLVSGIDESFEELRVKAVLALKNNAVQEYMKFESDQIIAAEQIYANGRNNIQQVYDQAVQNTQAAGAPPEAPAFGSSGSTFGGGESAFGSQPTSSTFGQPSTFGALGGNAPSPFGAGGTASSFGQSSSTPSAFSQQQQPTSSVFGQPSLPISAFGGSQTQTNPMFGQSSLIKPATGFGNNSSGGGFSAFAGQQPSAFGLAAASNTGGSVFGQTSNPPSSGFSGSSNTFGGGGTTSVFGAPVQGSSVFDAPVQGSTSAFGAPSSASAFGAPAGTSVFGAPAEGQGNSPSVFPNPSTVSAFGGGAPSAFGALAPTQQPASSAFGTSANITSPFAAPGSGTSAFGNTNLNNNAPISAFGVTSSPFGVQNQSQTSAFGGTAASTSVFGSNQPSVFGSSSTSAFSNVDPPKPSAPSKPKTGPPDFQNAASKYVPGASTNKYDALLPDNHVDLLPASAREAFEAKKFEWGKIPEWIPPIVFR